MLAVRISGTQITTKETGQLKGKNRKMKCIGQKIMHRTVILSGMQQTECIKIDDRNEMKSLSTLHNELKACWTNGNYIHNCGFHATKFWKYVEK